MCVCVYICVYVYVQNIYMCVGSATCCSVSGGIQDQFPSLPPSLPPFPLAYSQPWELVLTPPWERCMDEEGEEEAEGWPLEWEDCCWWACWMLKGKGEEEVVVGDEGRGSSTAIMFD